MIKYIDINNEIRYIKDNISYTTKKHIEEYIDFARKYVLPYTTIKKIIGIKYKIVNEYYNENAFLYENVYENLELD